MKLLRSVLVICCVAMLLAGCKADDSGTRNAGTDEKLCSAGRELALIMEEMIQSEVYTRLYANGGGGIDDIRSEVNTNDYDSPTAIYKITLPETEGLLTRMNPSSALLWGSLSDNLKKQIENRMNFSMVASAVNGAKGSSYLAFSSMYIATGVNESVAVETPVTYLYVFEKGAPIAVSFTERGGVQGQFLFMDDTETLSGVRNFFRSFGCRVERVEYR